MQTTLQYTDYVSDNIKMYTKSIYHEINKNTEFTICKKKGIFKKN